MQTILLLTTLFWAGIEFQQTQVSKMLDQYLAVKNALVQSDSKLAAKHAVLLAGILEDTTSEITESNSAKLYAKSKEQLYAKTMAIATSDNLEQQRVAFAELSELFWPLVKASDIGSRNVYYDYCPMKKVYWISEELAIKNPYYGASMLSCGTVKAKKK